MVCYEHSGLTESLVTVAKGKNTQPPSQLDVNELANVLSGLSELLGDEKLTGLFDDVKELKYDNEKLIKPALADIREILGRDVYATKAQVKDLEDENKALRTELDAEKERTRNYKLVENIVFGLVGFILLAVIGALVGLVVFNRGGS